MRTSSVVRGDVADPSRWQAVSDERWYIEKWVENPAEREPVANAGTSGTAGGEPTQVTLQFALEPCRSTRQGNL